MKPTEKRSLEDGEWRRLCNLVLAESDPQRISELVELLLKELDAYRDADRESEKSRKGNGSFESQDLGGQISRMQPEGSEGGGGSH
jgi:hypothetical protein